MRFKRGWLAPTRPGSLFRKTQTLCRGDKPGGWCVDISTLRHSNRAHSCKQEDELGPGK